MKNLIPFLRRLLAWLPYLWRDREHDYAYLLELMAFKMRRMAALHFAERDSDAGLLDCARILDRIVAGDYTKGELRILCQDKEKIPRIPSKAESEAPPALAYKHEDLLRADLELFCREFNSKVQTWWV